MTDKSNEPKILTMEDLAPHPVAWELFEDEVASRMEELVQFEWPGLSHTVRRKAPYYSHDRKKDIIFDVAIEVYASNQERSGSPLLLWLWECKDYPTRNVGVDEVEEFHAKMQQVRAHKGTIVTRRGFAEGAEEYAKSHRIGLMVLEKERFGVLQFSRDSDEIWRVELRASYCLYTSGRKVSGPHLLDAVKHELLVERTNWEDTGNFDR